jgi:hypothetical protein
VESKQGVTLLPCPFCGTEVKGVGIFGYDGIEHPENDCYLRGRVAYTEAWNRRPKDPRVEVLQKALGNLANEAAGFLSQADPSNHGNTNMNVLRLRIDEAKAALLSVSEGEKLK